MAAKPITYPDVTVKLIGTDGNAFALIGRVRRAIQQIHGSGIASEFVEKATQQGSYDELLQFIMQTVEVE